MENRDQRPYWHVDAKWISGLLFFAAWSTTLVGLALYQLTSPTVAIPVAGQALANMTEIGATLSDRGESDQDAVETPAEASFREQVLAAGDEGLQLFPGMDITITAADLEGRSDDEIRLEIFTQVAERVYWRGSEAVGGQPGREDMASTLGLMALFTESTHGRIGKLLLPLLIIDGLLLGLVVFFSRGGGRLISPGVALLASSLPGLLAIPLSLSQLSETPTPAASAVSDPTIIAGAFRESATIALESTIKVYSYSLAAGAILFIGGLAYAAISKIRRR